MDVVSLKHANTVNHLILNNVFFLNLMHLHVALNNIPPPPPPTTTTHTPPHTQTQMSHLLMSVLLFLTANIWQSTMGWRPMEASDWMMTCWPRGTRTPRSEEAMTAGCQETTRPTLSSEWGWVSHTSLITCTWEKIVWLYFGIHGVFAS